MLKVYKIPFQCFTSLMPCDFPRIFDGTDIWLNLLSSEAMSGCRLWRVLWLQLVDIWPQSQAGFATPKRGSTCTRERQLWRSQSTSNKIAMRGTFNTFNLHNNVHKCQCLTYCYIQARVRGQGYCGTATGRGLGGCGHGRPKDELRHPF